MSARSHLTSLTKRIGFASRFGSHRQLAAVIKSDDFMRRLMALPAELRASVMVCYAKAWARCEAVAAVPPSKARVSWDEMLIARLRKLAPRYPDDRDLARAMGLSPSQVKRARLRFVGRSADAVATSRPRQGRLGEEYGSAAASDVPGPSAGFLRRGKPLALYA